MPRKYLIVLFFMAFVGARHAVPLQVLSLLSGTAFAATQENGQPCPPECVIDSMEIVTWYPSPYNEYEELRLYPISDSNSQCNSDTRGLMYYDSEEDKVKLCKGPAGLNNWQDLGGGAYWDVSSAGSNDIYNVNSGNVGIGVGAGDSIGAKLQINMSTGTNGLVVKSAIEGFHIKNFLYTGGPQAYVVPLGVTSLTIEAYGAGSGDGCPGGKVVATVNVIPGETLYIYVGGAGAGAQGARLGGYNGGGNGGTGSVDYHGGGGGGASDVRQGGAVLINRIIVAGGGGGAGGAGGCGGSGGGFSGGSGGSSGGSGGTQIGGGIGSGGGSDGTFGSGGTGASGSVDAGGGGGGGYWGGGGGAITGGHGMGGNGGGGGSSYVTGTNALTQPGVNSGNGKVIINPVGIGAEDGNSIEWQDISGTVMSVVDINGNLALGASTANSYKLYVNGLAYVSSGAWSASDMRFKENILPLENPLNKILSLQGVSFEWNRAYYPQMNFEDNRQIGLIGQEVEKVLPEIVHTDSQGYKSIAYDKLGAVTIEAIKEQQKEIEELKALLKETARSQQKEIELLKAEKNAAE